MGKRKTKRYIVRERRCYTAEYLIEAVSAEAAGRLDGNILEEAGGDGDDHGDELLSVEETDQKEL
jgi:hypothetical protein